MLKNNIAPYHEYFAKSPAPHQYLPSAKATFPESEALYEHQNV